MYLIKDKRGNYFDAEKANSFEVRRGGVVGFEVVAIISGYKYTDVYYISEHSTKEDALEYMNALAKTINTATGARR